MASGNPSEIGSHNNNETNKKRFIQLQLLGVNDFHGQLNITRKFNGKDVGRVEYLAAYLKQKKAKNKNTLLVHAGDMVGASAPVSSLLQDEPTIKVLNKLGFDVGTLGNHEFDQGVKEMMRLIHGGFHPTTGYFEGTQFPYICANVIDVKTGKSLLPPYKIIKVNDIPIGFIGVVLDDTPSMVNSDGIKDIKFIDEVTAINQAVSQLKKQGVKAIIVLAHNEGRQTRPNGAPAGEIVEMAKKVDDEVDVMFAGHSHTFLNTEVDGKLLIQAYSYGTAFSDVSVEIDPITKEIVSKKAEIVMVYQESIKPDGEIKKMVEEYEAEVSSFVNEVVGKAADDIPASRNENGESALGNLIADSLRKEMHSDFAFINPGGIRADLHKGDITYGELLTILPFKRKLVKMTLTGEQIRLLLNQQWQPGKLRMLQISGLKYTWDSTKPVGSKVVDIFSADGTAIDPKENYTVTVNDYLADGGDNFTVFRKGTHKTAGPVDIDVFKKHVLQLTDPLTPLIEGRIKKIR
ncbi:5'-nucleotidase C-terminal domain-containing protein [Neobacillus pocheonensis]|uniref:bifunctional metallophosphatase/5'-nucleotidase n=1 Tax=Neobacillus pocheonensis TaxID=363869 RepID=UPI003D2E380E